MRRIVLSILLAASLTACSSSPGSPTRGQTGTLAVMLTDSPYSDAKAMLVTFAAVSAHKPGGPFATIPFDSGTERTCDLKQLVGAQDVLGVGTLDADRYTQLRLTISSAVLYFDNASSGGPCAPTISAPLGDNAPVEVSPGLLILNREFEVPAGGATTIVLDFDGDRSVRETGNETYRMTPVITVVSVQ